MNRKLLGDIGANASQVITNQVCGLVVFYILSVSFSKNDFGEISWSLAVLLAAFSILSLGLDQVMVKRIAGGSDPGMMLSAYALHVLIAGGLFYAILVFVHVAFPGFHHQVLLFLGFGKLMIFFASPFKQLANGLEKFRLLMYMSVTSNIIRSVLLLVFAWSARLSLYDVLVIFVAADIAELLVSFAISGAILKTRLSLTVSKAYYIRLVRESAPQAGVVIFTSAIARFDWILLGILASNVALAEYSFAFRVFELASLPLLVVAPLLIPRFTRIFTAEFARRRDANQNELPILFRWEMIIASLVALVLNMLWVPVIDYITANKYGSVNRITILLLSACLPLIFANNFLWTVNFARGKLKMIFYTFLLTFLVNVLLDSLLIPGFGGMGAAVGYFVAMFTQFIGFRLRTPLHNSRSNDYAIFIIPLAALCSGIAAVALFPGTIATLTTSLVFFLILLLISGLVTKMDWQIVKRVTGL
jgi:O-antigen/teichoic acid export membrane protein